ncbi:GAF domain-containing sensor histidine kinase [Polaribacter glomeratus]|uniref:histidine kinase n=1 Tax=Polaribacter glomeratus TaxID=102 RepID=A0A2S7WWS2_9FLAO|nr:ATP-binding protein [Polaribacter glomeratus]PQJ82018.1 histidine kinase [Polaribacter glomeratus]TXD66611.1 PAS domain S-box protein [Polaribacter glomeratus]
MNQDKVDILERALERQKKARKQAEEILEQKSLALFYASQELNKANIKLASLLDEKTSQLKGVFENINDSYVVIDIDGNVMKMNDVAENFFGYDLNLEKVNVVNLIYNEDYSYAMKSFSELMESGKFTDYTARIITKNKEIKWVHINASLIYDSLKKPIAAQGIIRDITVEREKRLIFDMINNIMKSILGKENIYDIAWEISSSIANYLSTDDCVIYLVDNKAKTLEQIAAYNKKAIQGKQVLNKVVIPFGKGIVGNVAKKGTSEIVINTSEDVRYILDDERRLSEITVPIMNEGKVIAVIDAEHKNKNYFIQEHINTIENIASLVSLQLKSAINIRERNKTESINKELLRKLEKSNEELHEYAHIVSHDLKSPLRSLAALTSWVKTDNIDAFDAASLQNFEDIDITLETMENLISDILKYSSLDAVVSEDEVVELDLLIKNLIHVLYVPDTISINILNKLPTVKGDKTKFQQLFQNLIGNAIKFNNKENGFIDIDVESYNSFYKFSIKDNGIGIQKRHFDSIFKIFQSLKKEKNSSGIGLSIVKKIVDIYKGEVWLESEINKGTTFYFTIKK